MLDQNTKRRIDTARQILVGKVPDPKAQVEQITTALIYKFMDDMDRENEGLGGKAKFLTGKLKQYSWGRLLSKELSGQERMLLYIDALSEFSKAEQIPELFRTIFKGTFLPYRDAETLNLFLKEINGFSYDHSEELGNSFEYLLSILGAQGKAGQFRTPRHIIDFIVEVVDPKKDDKILDPACGTAGFLISAYKHIRHQNSSNFKAEEYVPSFSRKGASDVALIEIQSNGDYHGDNLTPDARKKLAENIIGYDISPDMVRLSLVNMYLHGFKTPQIFEYDTLTYEDRWKDVYDIILANPPFMSPKGGIRPHKRFQIAANRSEVLFVDYIAEHLTRHGRAGIIVPEGIVFQKGTAYKSLRRMLLEDNLLWAIVSLPAGVFNPYAGVKTSILFLDREQAKRNSSVLFVTVNNDGFDLGAQRRAILKNDLPVAFVILSQWKEGVKEKHPLARWVEKKTILASTHHYLTSDSSDGATDSINLKWPMVRLGSLIDIQSGFAFSSRMFNNDDGVPIIRIRNIKTNSTDTRYKGDYDISFVVQNGDLLIGMDGEFNRVIWQGGVALLNQRVCRVTDYKKVLKEYVYYVIEKPLKDIERSTYAVTVKHLSVRQIKDIEIPLPPIEEQQRIVKWIADEQVSIEQATKKIEEHEQNIANKIAEVWGE